jgi:hypothetical protein
MPARVIIERKVIPWGDRPCAFVTYRRRPRVSVPHVLGHGAFGSIVEDDAQRTPIRTGHLVTKLRRVLDVSG